MKFLLQENSMNIDSLTKIKKAILDNNIPYVIADVIPFSDKINTSEPLEGSNYIPCGSTLLSNICKDRKYLGMFLDYNFTYSVATRNRSDMLNDEIIMSIGESIDWFKANPDTVYFIRPDEDLKFFSGQVMNSDEIWPWLEDASSLGEASGTYYMSPETKIVIAKPKEIQAEWRWFVVDGKIISGSMYRFKGNLHKSEELDIEVIYEAQKMADIWLPAKCCVMDLALVDDKLYVVEFNTINSSGFYNHNVDKIITSLYNYCLKLEETVFWAAQDAWYALSKVVKFSIGEMTIREYFHRILQELWSEKEGFSGKRPFGNSAWDFEIYSALIQHNFIDGKLDSNGYVESMDKDKAHEFVKNMITQIF